MQKAAQTHINYRGVIKEFRPKIHSSSAILLRLNALNDQCQHRAKLGKYKSEVVLLSSIKT